MWTSTCLVTLPMRWDLAEPGDAGVLHRDGWVEALGDDVADQRRPLLFEQLDQPPLLLHQRINPPRLPIKEVGDGAAELPAGTAARLSSLPRRFRLRCAASSCHRTSASDHFDERRRQNDVVEVACCRDPCGSDARPLARERAVVRTDQTCQTSCRYVRDFVEHDRVARHDASKPSGRLVRFDRVLRAIASPVDEATGAVDSTCRHGATGERRAVHRICEYVGAVNGHGGRELNGQVATSRSSSRISPSSASISASISASGRGGS